jgi:hypothetical protein
VTAVEDKISSCKILYSEIILGFSEFDYLGKPIFVKHFTELENGEIIKHKTTFEKEAVLKGLEYKQDKIDFFIKEKLWDREKELEVEKLKKEISDLELVIKNLIIKRQIKETTDKIKNNEKKIRQIEVEKNSLVGFCVEDYIDKKYNELVIYDSFFEDRFLTKKAFTKNKFEELEEAALVDLIHILNSFYERFNLKQIKRISACSFLMNLFFLCENNPYYFFGKFVKDLTIFQSNLFSQSRHFKFLIENKAQTSPPSDVAEDPDKMIEWYDMVASQKEIEDSDSAGVGHFGASMEELKKMAGGNALTLKELAEKKGGKLTKQDFINMQGL